MVVISITSQVTAIITIQPMTVVCAGAFTANSTIMIVLSSVGLAGVLSQYGVVLSPPLTLMDTVRVIAGFVAVAQQQPQSQMTCHSGLCHYAVCNVICLV